MKMECNCCGTWVHAECEELSGEDFRLLCNTKSIEYICSLCCPEKIWKIAISDKLSMTESNILSVVSWMESKQQQKVPRQKISVTAKVFY